MSLLDQLESDKYDPENRGHPSEGMLRGGTFTVIEGGDSHSFSVKQYPNVTMDMLRTGAELSNGVVLTEGEFEMCYSIYNTQANVYIGTATQEELDEELANVVSNQAAQQQIQQQSQPPQPAGTPAQAPGAQTPQTQPAPAAKPKPTMQDIAKILVNDVDGALGKPVYELMRDVVQEAQDQGFEMDEYDDNYHPLIEGWKNGIIKIEDDGSFDETLLPAPEPEEEEDEDDDA